MFKHLGVNGSDHINFLEQSNRNWRALDTEILSNAVKCELAKSKLKRTQEFAELLKVVFVLIPWFFEQLGVHLAHKHQGLKPDQVRWVPDLFVIL
jgi:hypothetical protein